MEKWNGKWWVFSNVNVLPILSTKLIEKDKKNKPKDWLPISLLANVFYYSSDNLEQTTQLKKSKHTTVKLKNWTWWNVIMQTLLHDKNYQP